MTVLFMFFTGAALCFLRAPKGDRLHSLLCGVAVALWLGMLVVEPRTRTPMFGLIAGSFLMASMRMRSRAAKP